MMSKQLKLIIGKVLGVGTVMIIFLGSLLFLFEEEPKTIVDEEYRYSVDLDTVLDDLAQGKVDVFFPQDENLVTNPNRELSKWTADDYFIVADAALQTTWGESVENWQIYVAIYDWDCDYISVGPDVAHIGFFKVEKIDGQTIQFSSYVVIDLLDNYISISKEAVNLPVLEMLWRKRGVSPSNLLVPAQEILEIAEVNGGADFRKASDNKCAVSAFINPDTVQFDGNWKVSYNGLMGTQKFIIEPDTGKLVENESDSP